LLALPSEHFRFLGADSLLGRHSSLATASSPLPFGAGWHNLFRDMLLSGPFSGLLTDLYELTMAAGYVQKRFDARATFELFVRTLPSHRNYLVAAGLEQALEFLENVRFSDEDVAYLRAQPFFRNVHSDFFDYLSRFQFTGDVWALSEGTIFFPGEPLLRVAAPIADAQLVETSLLSILHFQTLIASKASRVTTAAAGRPVVEFGSRRAHGMEAGVLAARAAFIGGCEGTSNTYAGRRFGIPVYGTQAHSWIMAHEDEAEAFRDFLDVFPEESTLLVDTYDVHEAIEKIIALGRKPSGVRLDSGDVLADSRWARKRLDQAGWSDVKIFASGELDEERIEVLLQSGARIDAFGVGTALSTSSDSPNIGVIYKLVEVDTGDTVRSAAKFSQEKITYPGRKQVFRFLGRDGKFSEDVIGLDTESFPGSDPLLVPVMREGRRIPSADQDPFATIKRARSRHLADRVRLPERILALSQAQPAFPVRYSERLEELRDQVRQSVVKAARI
jgi:nicotinate phosphoribosyltransferase